MPKHRSYLSTGYPSLPLRRATVKEPVKNSQLDLPFLNIFFSSTCRTQWKRNSHISCFVYVFLLTDLFVLGINIYACSRKTKIRYFQCLIFVNENIPRRQVSVNYFNAKNEFQSRFQLKKYFLKRKLKLKENIWNILAILSFAYFSMHKPTVLRVGLFLNAKRFVSCVEFSFTFIRFLVNAFLMLLIS